jgi:hypothetical protein
MTREIAVKMIEQYCKVFVEEGGKTPFSTTLTEAYLRFPAEGSTSKAMRWLGFMQGAAFAFNVFSLKEIKEHSRLGEVTR